MEKIFVGGYATSGSRVPMMILERAGYYVGTDGGMSYDFGQMEFVAAFSQWILDKTESNKQAFKDVLDKHSGGRDSWALKHGHLMLIVPQLKIWYPSCKFILTVRHPLDQIIRWKGFIYPNDVLFTPPDVPLKSALDEYDFLHTAALENTDLVWRLEDVCSDPLSAISKLLDFAKIDDDANKYLDLIHPSSTIGLYRHPVIQKMGYEL